jgi:hypothetical protein
MSRWPLAVFLAAILLPAGMAADLSKVDRNIRKEPKYAGKPQYGLIVFGSELSDRLWLVRDGDVLYADRNGNGDLTEPQKRIVADKDGSDLAFHVGSVRIGKLEHRDVRVGAFKLSRFDDAIKSYPASKAALKKDKDAYAMMVRAEVAAPGFRGEGDDGRLFVMARLDSDGPLFFGDTPADAPVVNFGGPFAIHSESERPALYRNIVHDLMLSVGTPGLGSGTFAHVAYEQLIPKGAYVVVDAEFPPAKAGSPPIKQHFDLKERC